MSAWILLFLPLAVVLANQLVLNRAGLAPLASVASAAVTFVLALLLLGSHTPPPPIEWATVGDLRLVIGLQLDPLATGMMVVVTGVGLLVHVFSLGYMREDDAKARYFTGLSLFMFSMTGVVLASNLAMTFIFWELVGLSSYLLIGHWYRKASAADAAKKAFITNRVGDFGFLVGILLVWGVTGTVVFDGMREPLLAFRDGHPELWVGVLTAAVLCLFCGAVGKSAQFPLHVWLPDAMEGPTPVSALIHAATMVAAGVYMLFRVQVTFGAELFGQLHAGPVIAWTGGFTALLAALMAVQQDDIKRVLAYSTLSQLGYMVMAVGLAAGEAAMFHLFTHAWFKALLFLASGAVIYACHHEQDIWKMGGLARRMPVTTATFAAGLLALIALPGTSGFFSKELILDAAWESNRGLFWLAALVAVLTPFYMTRLWVVAFMGRPRGHGAEHAREVGPVMWLPLAALGVLALIGGYGFMTRFSPVPELQPGFHPGFVMAVSVVALVAGVAGALLLYRGRSADPVNLPLLRERFRIDWLYDNVVVRYGQNVLAAVVHFVDEFVINCLVVGGLSRGVASVGQLCRRLQSGSLQGYAFVFGLGVVVVVWLTVF